jgi:3-mercaptopyruvate sulfurtransferase SseA
MTKKCLAVAAVLTVCLASSAFAQPSPDRVPRMKLEEFKILHDRNAVTVVDVRSQSEYREGHIPGALLVPLAILESQLQELSQRPQPIVTYCS